MYINQDINNMKVWVFRLAQTRWKKTSEQCVRIFEDNDLYTIISNGYDYLHLMSYESVVTELKKFLQKEALKYMTELKDGMILYHGSYTIVQEIDLFS